MTGPIRYVELFQLLFLDQLGRRLDQRHFALKGGCNLRFFFKRQVLAYLSVSHREQYDSESVWETIQLTVAEALGSTGS